MIKKVKLALLLLFISSTLFAINFRVPRQDGYVRDITHTLTAEQEQELETLSQQLESKSGDQVATLVVNDFDGETLENAAVKTFESWGIGQKGKDNGVLFIVALKEHKMRIEVGYGLEGVLPDGKTGALLDQFVKPLMKQGQFAQGIMEAHKHIIYTLDPTFISHVSSQKVVTRTVPLTKLQTFIIQNILILILVIIIGLLIISPGFRTFLFLLLLSGRWGGGGNGGFGGGNSGFGGFGGGSSGGGGASRDW